MISNISWCNRINATKKEKIESKIGDNFEADLIIV